MKRKRWIYGCVSSEPYEGHNLPALVGTRAQCVRFLKRFNIYALQDQMWEMVRWRFGVPDEESTINDWLKWVYPEEWARRERQAKAYRLKLQRQQEKRNEKRYQKSH